jgi:starch synthase
MLPREEVRQVLTRALAFLCPSVYEPLGIVNLEAMACETAVVSSNVGGIPEVVLDGETGVVVRYDPDDTTGFERGIAEGVNRLAADPELAETYGRAGRERAVTSFAWDAIAAQTVALYESLR